MHWNKCRAMIVDAPGRDAGLAVSGLTLPQKARLFSEATESHRDQS